MCERGNVCLRMCLRDEKRCTEGKSRLCMHTYLYECLCVHTCMPKNKGPGSAGGGGLGGYS